MLSNRCNVCECPNGKAATGAECIVHGANACVTCEPGFYLRLSNGVSTHTTPGKQTGECVAHQTCKAGEWTKATGDETTDTVCSACSAGRFRAKAPTDNKAEKETTVCNAHTDCDAEGRVQKVAGSNTADAVCGADKVCVCANGLGATGTACPQDKDAKCVSCTGKYFLDGTQCKPWTVCIAEGKTEKTPGSNTADAVCGGNCVCVCVYACERARENGVFRY